jgi:hypothetical protein
MAATTMPAVYDRVNSLVAGTPFSFTRALEPFSFDLQPFSDADQKFRVEANLVESEGYIGYTQAEQWECHIWLARAHKGAPHTAHRQLLVDVTSLTASLAREGALRDFNLDDETITSEVSLPSEDDAFLVAELVALLDFDRTL